MRRAPRFARTLLVALLVAAALADAVARQFPDRYRDLDQLPFTDGLPESGSQPLSLAGLVALLLMSAVWLILTVRAQPSRRVRPPVGR
jgi:hypothetical protein